MRVGRRIETNIIRDGAAALVQVPIKDGRRSKEASDDFVIKASSWGEIADSTSL